MAEVFNDTFTGSGDIAGRTPDTTGTTWDTAIDTSAETPMKIQSSNAGSDENDAGNAELYTGSDSGVNADQDVIVTMSTIIDDPDRSAHIVGRYADSSNFYAVRMNGQAASGCELYKYVAASRTQLDTFANLTSGDTVKLEMIGSAIKVYVDDVEVASATDSAITAAGAGGMGMGTIAGGTDGIDNGHRFDDFIINETAAAGGANPKGPFGMPLHGPFGGPI